LVADAQPLLIGQYGGGCINFNGLLDNIHIAPTTGYAAWIDTQNRYMGGGFVSIAD
jgi:hypothetical protein